MANKIFSCLILLACGLACNARLHTYPPNLRSGSTRPMILNELDLLGTCTKTCEEVPDIYNNDACTKLSGCQFNSAGWNSGFVRCDYCRCDCTEDQDAADVVVEKKKLSTNEEELFGTCKNDCNRGGLVRTDALGCQEIWDCKTASKGKVCGFYRNDYCECDCVNRKYAASYEMVDIVYDVDGAELFDGEPDALENVDLVNHDPDRENVASATMKVTYTQTKTMETTESMQVGLEVSVSVGINIEIMEGSETITASTTAGYSYTEGSSTSESHEFSVTAGPISVPPNSKISATLSGAVIKADIPYTATLVTTFEDGTTQREHIEGMYTDVETARFTVSYDPAEELPPPSRSAGGVTHDFSKVKHLEL